MVGEGTVKVTADCSLRSRFLIAIGMTGVGGGRRLVIVGQQSIG